MKCLSSWLDLAWLVTAILAITLGWSQPLFAEGPSDVLAGIETLDLPAAARIALAGNPTAAAARERLLQARQAVLQAYSAYFPTVNFNAAASRVNLAANSQQIQLLQALGSTTTEEAQDIYSASLTASWILFDGFAREFTLAMARHGKRVSMAANDDVRRVLLQSVVGAFLNAQLALENIAIAKADEAFNQRQLTEAKLRNAAGTGALSAVLNFQVRANSAISDRIVAQRLYQTSRIALAALLGLADAAMPARIELSRLAPATKDELAPPDLTHLLEAAQNRRPDLQQGQWAVRLAAADVKAQRANYYFPTLALSATYAGERYDDKDFEEDDFGDTVAISLTYNLFAGGLFKAQHQEAKARLREAEKSRQAIKLNIAAEVRATAARVSSAQQQLLLQRANADLVKRNRDLVEKEYKAGVGSLVRLNEAQRDLTRASVSLTNARAALHQAAYDLQSATGQILNTFGQ